MEHPTEVNANRRRLALAAVWLCAAWVATGAFFKLFWGTPALLPRVVRDLPLELGLTYKLAIGIELAIVAVALTKPRWGWALLVAQYAVFEAVLATQIAAGDTNCGCFGSARSVPPKYMAAIDGVLLVALLASRPWRHLGRGAPPAVPIVAAAVALALPWFFDREVRQGAVVADGQPAEGQWIPLELDRWVGLDIWDTRLGQPPLNEYVDVNALPLDGLWVFWRATCDHCKTHLEELAASEHGERLITLVQLEEATDTAGNRIVNVLPEGNFVQHARLPAAYTYVLTTPGELLLEAGRIVAGAEGVTSETTLAKPR